MGICGCGFEEPDEVVYSWWGGLIVGYLKEEGVECLVEQGAIVIRGLSDDWLKTCRCRGEGSGDLLRRHERGKGGCGGNGRMSGRRVMEAGGPSY